MHVDDHGIPARDDGYLIVLQMTPDHVASFTVSNRSATFDSSAVGMAYERPVSFVARHHLDRHPTGSFRVTGQGVTVATAPHRMSTTSYLTKA
jgi:hypothetical protein